MNYTFHQLQIFLAVYKHKSITRASEELNLTQPAVSIQLKKFQDQFDIPLTEVIGRQLYITGFGEEIALVANKVLDSSSEIQFVNDRYKGLLTGDIHFSVVSTGKYVMPFFLKQFAGDHPGVKITIDVTNKNQVLEALYKNTTDFALISVIPDDLKTDNIELLDNSLYLVGATHQINQGAIELKDLNELTFIFREDGSATKKAMTDFLDRNEIVPKRSMQLVSNEAVKQAVIAGLGYSIMPVIGLRNEIKSGDLSIIPIKGLPIKTKWNLVYNKGKKFTPATAAFQKYMDIHKLEVIESNFGWIKKVVG